MFKDSMRIVSCPEVMFNISSCTKHASSVHRMLCKKKTLSHLQRVDIKAICKIASVEDNPIAWEKRCTPQVVVLMQLTVVQYFEDSQLG
jgi:hypothetical protein